mmetsp:Transcript_95878/g.266337  ORF Transcript_95878/g.266337 Transcript_95878/m.266337 type:complete len:241 (-) Transcript_95878:1303-2025(-)
MRRHAEVARVARPRGQHGEVGLRHAFQGALDQAVPDRDHLRARLPQVVGERVHKGVLEVDEQHPQAAARALLRARGRRGGRGRGRAQWRRHGQQGGGGLELRLLLLGLRDAVEEQRRARADLAHAVADPQRPQRQAGVQVPVEGDVPNGGAVPAALRGLHLLDELHGPDLGSAAHRHCPRVHEEGVDRVELGAEVALDVVHRVDELAVHLDLAPPEQLDGPVLADPRLVVPVHVRAHGDL